MNSLRIGLKDGKRFLGSAALAALFVLLAGAANALANTVWCVPNTGISTACTPGAGKTHIQDAVFAPAAEGDVILVGPGYYNETVEVNVAFLSIFGAQAGNDARVRQNNPYNPPPESIVDATPTAKLYGSGGGAAFYIDADNVVIDGFTIEGGTAGYAAGVLVGGDEDYNQILNNIIQNNAVGVSLYDAYYGNLIEYNLIQNNNYGKPSGSDYPATLPGVGIAASEPEYSDTITENAFEKNLAAAMFIYDGYGVEITKNTSKDDGSFVIFYDCYEGGAYFDHNQGQDFGAKGVWPFWTSYPPADAAVDLIYDNEYMEINDNDLEGGKVAGYNGIAFTNIYESYRNCEDCQVSNNTICHFKGNGIVAELPTDYEETLSYSLISMNDVEDNGGDGILIEGNAYTYNEYNLLFDNKAKGNGGLACADYTVNSFTLGTYDTWFNNSGSPSYPTGLCSHAWH